MGQFLGRLAIVKSIMLIRILAIKGRPLQDFVGRAIGLNMYGMEW